MTDPFAKIKKDYDAILAEEVVKWKKDHPASEMRQRLNERFDEILTRAVDQALDTTTMDWDDGTECNTMSDIDPDGPLWAALEKALEEHVRAVPQRLNETLAAIIEKHRKGLEAAAKKEYLKAYAEALDSMILEVAYEQAKAHLNKALLNYDD